MTNRVSAFVPLSLAAMNKPKRSLPSNCARVVASRKRQIREESAKTPNNAHPTAATAFHKFSRSNLWKENNQNVDERKDDYLLAESLFMEYAKVEMSESENNKESSPPQPLQRLIDAVDEFQCYAKATHARDEGNSNIAESSTKSVSHVQKEVGDLLMKLSDCVNQCNEQMISWSFENHHCHANDSTRRIGNNGKAHASASKEVAATAPKTTFFRRPIQQRILSPIYPILLKSPIAERMYCWPRGYMGDFETIEHLMGQKTAGGEFEAANSNETTTIGRCIDNFILNHPLSQQHRNKVRHQAQMMMNSITTKTSAKISSGRCEVLSLACGACPDVRDIQSMIVHAGRSSNCHFTLLDQDPNALKFSRHKLGESFAQARCTLVEGNVLRRSPLLKHGKRFDLIVAGGLFDYLSDKMALRLMRYIWNHLLDPGGSFFFTNIAPGYGKTYCIHLIFNWSLHCRSRNELIHLCEQAGIPKTCVTTEFESTGLTVLVTVIKPLSSS